MEIFLNYLSSYGSLSEESKKILTEYCVKEDIPKEHYLLKAGETADDIRFITDGIVRLFYCDREGNEFTRYLLNEGHFAVNLQSYNEEIPSSEYLETLTHCSFIRISRKAMNLFYTEVPEWTELIRKITEKALLGKIELKNLMLQKDATERYLFLAERYPDLLRRVPLGYVASFLGITQSSLSRIRKNVSKSHLFAK